MGVTRGWLPQRAGSSIAVGVGHAAAVPLSPDLANRVVSEGNKQATLHKNALLALEVS